jgi:hypothetical protein
MVVLAGGMLAASTTPASATVPATVSVSPSAGPVGSVVRISVSGPSGESSGCTGVTFARSAGGGTALAPGTENGVVGRFVVPSFFGAPGPGQFTAVTPGSYVFRVTCGSMATGGLVTSSAAFTVTTSALPPSRFVGMATMPTGKGYWLAQVGGGVFSYGDAPFYGSLPGDGVVSTAPITGIAATPDGKGYWLVSADGGVFSFGDARFCGSLPGDGVVPHAPIVGITADPAGGYWLVGADGGVFAFGPARFYGSAPGRGGPVGDAPFVDLGATSDGGAYYEAAATGWSVGYGNIANANTNEPFGIPFPGVPSPSTSQLAGPLTSLITGIAVTPSGEGVWLVGADGGVFSVGAPAGNHSAPPPFFGSLPSVGVVPSAPIVGMAAAPGDTGYWLVGADGGVFAFGSAGFYGSAGGSGLRWQD